MAQNMINGYRRLVKKILNSNVLSGIASICAGLFVFSNSQIFIVDDAYIFVRYAKNFVYHGQLVFNLGERVEGITSFLWTMVLAFNEFFFKIRYENFVVLISWLIIALLGFRIWSLYRKIEQPWLGFLSFLLLISNKNFIISSTNGLESGLYGYLLFEMIFAFWERKITKSFIISGLVFLTRPEGVVFGLFVLGIVLIINQYNQSILRNFLPYLAILISISIFRLLYYGQVLPNSLIAKSVPWQFLGYGLAHAVIYIYRFAKSNILFVSIVLFSLLYILNICIRSISSAGTRRKLLIGIKESIFIDQEFTTIVLSLMIVLYSFVVVMPNGGDWMPAFRLLTQYFPIYIMLMFLLVKSGVITGRIVTLVGLIMVFLLFYSYPNPKFGFPVVNYGFDYYEDISKRLENRLEVNDVISAEAIGYISHLLPEQPIFDPLGLTNEYIAKHGKPALTYGKMDNRYLLETIKPTIVIWHWGGHLKGYKKIINSFYVTYCRTDCGNLNADLVLIRKDEDIRFRNAFLDWKIVLDLSDVFH